jgi:hypothetical protein
MGFEQQPDGADLGQSPTFTHLDLGAPETPAKPSFTPREAAFIPNEPGPDEALPQPSFTPAVQSEGAPGAVSPAERDAAVVDTGEQAIQAEWSPDPNLPETNRKQQDKLLTALLTRDGRYLTMPGYSMADSMYENTKSSLSRRVVSPEELIAMLGNIIPPYVNQQGQTSVGEVYSQVTTQDVEEQYRHSQSQKKKILTHFTGLKPGDPNIGTPAEMLRFLAKYPNPVVFDGAAEMYLTYGIAPANTPEKVAEYRGSMAAFKHNVYGKRQEYLEQFQILFGKDMMRDNRWRSLWHPELTARPPEK